MEEESLLSTLTTADHEYDSSFSSHFSVSGVSESKVDGSGRTTSRTHKTESSEMSLLEVFENLERESEIGADGDAPKLDFPEIMELLGGTQSDGTTKMDVPEILGLLEVFEGFEKENSGQKSLITEIQNENTKLTLELKTVKERERKTKEKHMNEVRRLTAELETLKSKSNFDIRSNSPNMLLKSEVERLVNELESKSKEIMKLTTEISKLKNIKPRSRIESVQSVYKSTGANLEEKEAEYQKNLRKLQNQVRTLQRILYHRDSTSLPVGINQTGEKMDDEMKQCDDIEKEKMQKYFEDRVAELEIQLKSYKMKENVQGNSDNTEETLQIVQLQARLVSQVQLVSGLKNELSGTKSQIVDLLKEKGLLEFRIRELNQELSLSKSQNRNKPERKQNIEDVHILEIQRLTSELETLKSNNDLGSESSNTLLKSEVDRLTNELEGKSKQIMRLTNELLKLKNTRPLGRKGSAQSIDKSVTVMLEEKEAEYQKNLRKLQLQVRTLQRILYHKDPTSLPNVINQTANKMEDEMKQDSDFSREKEQKKVLELRVAELEKQLKSYTLKDNVNPTQRTKETVGDDELIGQLRARLVSQMQLVTCLKNHLSGTKSQVTDLLKGKGLLEFRIRELNQELTLAKSLSKPENEILAELTEKVQTLSSRYFYREKELDNLIRRLSVKNLTNSCPPFPSTLLEIPNSLTGYQNHQSNNQSLALLLGDYNSNGIAASTQSNNTMDLGLLSPTTALHLLGESVDDILLMKR